ncbi:hypothetical protein KY285_024073 [Solanum tuberosum]|nr:hypothetical protein KY289_025805 [Solanum tuberosum]KAH0676272.1 hypothetical protein KY285_024073 [Solanum tuberosum]
MYSIERYLRTLKSYIRNPGHPKGAIAEGHDANKGITFFSHYFKSISTKFNKPARNDDGFESNGEMSIFKKSGQTKGSSDGKKLPHDEFNQAVLYILQNCEEVSPFIEEYMREIEIQGSTRPHGMLNNDFIYWFRARILVLASQGCATDELISLVVGPKPLVHRYSIFMVNGFRFQTKELVRKTQNSGVLVRGDDSNSNKEYYGVLEDIYELCYVGNRKSEQVFYLKDMVDKDWLIVVKTNLRDLFNMPEVEEAVMNEEAYQQEEMECNILGPNDHEPVIHVSLYKDDVEPQIACEMKGTGRGRGRGQTPNPSQGRLQVEQISSDPLQRTSPGTQSSRNLEESIRPSLKVEIGAVSRINRKRRRGKYKSKTVDIKTKYGGKINVIIPDDIDRTNIISKHGEAMWYKVKDKFEDSSGLRAHKLQDFVISTMQRLFRAWKARLHNHYCAYSTDENRLSNRPEDVELEDWKYLVKYFGSEKFKRDPLSGEKDSLDKVWEIQHTRYVHGKGYGKKPPKKAQIQQADIEASVSSAMESMRQEMQADMERKLQEEREHMAADLKRGIEEDLQKKMEEEREHMKGEVDKMFQEQMVAIMTRMQ